MSVDSVSVDSVDVSRSTSVDLSVFDEDDDVSQPTMSVGTDVSRSKPSGKTGRTVAAPQVSPVALRRSGKVSDGKGEGGSESWGERCGVKLRNRDGRCTLPMGFGTEHLGSGQCKYHGGTTAVGIRTSARKTLELLTGYYDANVNPLDALLTCVRIAAAEVSYFTSQIADLEDDQVVVRPTTEAIAKTGQDSFMVVDLRRPRELNMWIRARQQSMDALARYCSLALKAGVDERLVRIAEGTGDKLAMALEAVFEQLDLTPEQKAKAPDAIRMQLSLLEKNGTGIAATG